jgi:hypothetical protein
MGSSFQFIKCKNKKVLKKVAVAHLVPLIREQPKKPKSKFFRKKCLPKRRFKAIIRKSVLIQKQIARFDITNAELGFVSH